MDRIKLTISMACRNLLRNRRRTISTLLAIAVGLVGLTFRDGYMTYSMHGLRESVIHNGTGHIQAALSPAYFDEGDGDPMPFMLPDAKSSSPSCAPCRRSRTSFRPSPSSRS